MPAPTGLDPWENRNRNHNNCDLKFDVKRMLKARNVLHPATFLIRAGISNASAINLLKNRLGGIKWEQLQKICIALNCTPNDLFTYTGNPSDLPVGHELNGLIRTPVESLQDKLLKLPANKLEKLRKMIEDEEA